MSDRPQTALTRPIAEPSKPARRFDKARRVVESPITVSGVAIATGGLLLAPVPLLVPFGFACGYVASVVVLRRRVAKFVATMREAYAAADTGSFAIAEADCQAAMATSKWPVSHLAAVTWAYFLRRQARIEEAIELCGEAAKSDDGLLRRVIGLELAVCYALSGKTGPAMTWLPKVGRHSTPNAASYAIVFSRIGKTDRLMKMRLRLKRNEAVFFRHEARVLAIMKAFAVFRERSDYLSIRPLLLDAGPAFAGEFDYLGASWPEMKEFVDTYVAPPE